MQRVKILWIDDEIDQLKSHIHFLDNRGYDIIPVTNGDDGIEVVRRKKLDIVLLDEMMAGKDGLSTLREIKEIAPGLPVIMITKNEEESLMEEAIGSKITDYLTKPVNPSQILSACKKILDADKISEEKLSSRYMSELRQISIKLMEPLDYNDWIEIHAQLSNFEIEFDELKDTDLRTTLLDQKRECNTEFGKFIERKYLEWLKMDYPGRPILSPDVIELQVAPHLREGKKVLFILIDGMRLDQWLTLEPLLYDMYHIKRNYYYSILPSATPYARNAIFAGKFPLQISKDYPEIWKSIDDDDLSMNRFESEMLNSHVNQLNLELRTPPKYIKVLDSDFGKTTVRKIANSLHIQFISMVLNFVDILAHRRSDTDILKEIVPDEASYRSIVRTWFRHSWLYEIFRFFSDRDFTLVVTSDHGSIRVLRDVKLVADRETSTNIRYKYGRNLNLSPKYGLVIKEPEEYLLPSRGVNLNYVLCKEDYYFVYPTHYHKYVKQYYDTFQHGGISLEEMIVPVVTLTPR